MQIGADGKRRKRLSGNFYTEADGGCKIAIWLNGKNVIFILSGGKGIAGRSFTENECLIFPDQKKEIQKKDLYLCLLLFFQAGFSYIPVDLQRCVSKLKFFKSILLI